MCLFHKTGEDLPFWPSYGNIVRTDAYYCANDYLSGINMRTEDARVAHACETVFYFVLSSE